MPRVSEPHLFFQPCKSVFRSLLGSVFVFNFLNSRKHLYFHNLRQLFPQITVERRLGYYQLLGDLVKEYSRALCLSFYLYAKLILFFYTHHLQNI